MVRVAGLEDLRVRIAVSNRSVLVKGTCLYLSITIDQNFIEGIWRKTRAIFLSNLKADIPQIELTSHDGKQCSGIYYFEAKRIIIHMPNLIRGMNRTNVEINENNLKAAIGSILVHEFMHHLYCCQRIDGSHHKLMLHNKKMWKVMIEVIKQYSNDLVLMIAILSGERWSCRRGD